jgi:hypothetical protein
MSRYLSIGAAGEVRYLFLIGRTSPVAPISKGSVALLDRRDAPSSKEGIKPKGLIFKLRHYPSAKKFFMTL